MSETSPSARKPAASIADVARLANVSISTVSRVINRSELVNEKTRLRVDAAIRKLGYQPNAFARGLMLRRSDILGLVLPDLHGEFYSEIIRGANVQARENGYHLVVASVSNNDDGLLSTVMQHAILDGVAVMVSELTDDVQQLMSNVQRPVVVLDDEVTGRPHDSVLIDQRSGTHSLIEHLIQNRGLRRLVFVGGPQTNVDSRARLSACREALVNVGLGIHDADVHHLDYQFETARAFAAEHVREWCTPRTCIFAANDEMAAGIVAAGRAAGLSVPENFGVVGFDDTRIARMTKPSITTVRVPMADMGAKAIDLLCQRVSEPDRPPTRVSLEPQLIVRESCAMAEAATPARAARRAK